MMQYFKLMATFLATIFMLSVHTLVSGHTYKTGVCPLVEPMQNFEMKQFTGIWYAIQKTTTASSCLIYNITNGDEPGEYLIEQTSQHFALGLTPLKHEYSYTGELSQTFPDVPAKMTVKFPLSVAGTATFTVFMTDYTQYAGIFSCQKIGFAHRQSATILSRTKALDRIYIDKIRSRLTSYNVNPFDLSIISHNDCPKDEDKGFNIHIDPETFSAQSIGGAVKKAGEKLGDGVEWTVNATKKVYHKLANSNQGASGAADADDHKKIILRADSDTRDAEWLPSFRR